ncbi:MAG: DNA cytosine methyltransferase [Halanaerobiales bacterium]
MKLILKKTIKASKRGITFSFKDQGETKFSVGAKYRYMIDIKNKKMVIFSSENGGLKVSKKRHKDSEKPLFDIRKKEALKAFKGVEYLQVSVYEDEIIVEGFIEDKSNSNNVKDNDSNKPFINIQELIKVKKTAEVSMSKALLNKVVGDNYPGQMDIFEILSPTAFEVNVPTKNTSNSVRKTKADVVDFIKPFGEIEFPLQVVSLFSGAGLLDYGFKKEGFDIVFAIDVDEDACKTYRRNFGDYIKCHDICTYPKDKVPKAEIIIGGPSCKPFSRARGDYNTIKGQIENHKDSELIAEYIKWIKSEYSDYKIFVLENVPDLLTASDGAYLKMLKEELKDFDISYDIVNDIEQGGYQNRKRAILIGSKIGKIEVPKSLVPKKRQNTVADALNKVDESWPNYNDVSVPKEKTVERMKYVPQGGNWQCIPENLRTKAKHSNSYKRLALDGPCVTLVNYRKPVIIHPTENRILTVSEAAALSGLEKDFIFEGRLSSKQQQVGNGVPVSLGRSVARAVKEAIIKYCNKNKVCFS